MGRYYPRRRGPQWMALRRLMIDPRFQYISIVLVAVTIAALVFSGYLLVQYNDAHDMLSQGKAELREGKIAWAVRTFQNLVTRQPENYEARVWLGQAYLELGEAKKAEQEFQIATVIRNQQLKEKNDKSGSLNTESDQLQQLAMAKLFQSRGEYEQAESKLQEAYKLDKTSETVKRALFTLYQAWGEKEEKDDKLTEAVRRYEQAIPYATDYQLEESLRQKLVDGLSELAKAQVPDTSKTYPKAVYEKALGYLKRALKHQYSPSTLIAVADFHERAGHLDEAIVWYRKAFQLDPSVISIKLFTVLQQKAEKLEKAGDKAGAERYLLEAKQLASIARMKPEMLYPVSVGSVRVQPSQWDPSSGVFLPVVKGVLVNESEHRVGFLALKAELLVGDQLLDEIIKPLVTNTRPLKPKGLAKSTQAFSLPSGDTLSLYRLENKQLTVKLYVAYTQEEPKDWVLKAVHKATIGFPSEAPDTSPDEAPSDRSAPSSSGNGSAPIPGGNPPIPPGSTEPT